MDLLYIPALASFSGSASGTLASIVTGWVTQRRMDRVRHTLRATSQREELYKDFIEEASRLYADALVNDKSEISKLVDLYSLIARMKILSGDAVIEAAEKAAHFIIETYLSPNRTFVDLGADQRDGSTSRLQRSLSPRTANGSSALSLLPEAPV